MKQTSIRPMGKLTVGLILVLLTGCGGENPLTVLQKNSDQAFPELQLPFPGTPNTLTPYSPSNDGFTFTGLGTQVQVLAPADGVVIGVTEVSGSNDSVIIYHSRYLTTRITMGTVSAREGDSVKAGQQIGTVTDNLLGSDSVKLTVYLNGKAVCPLSFLNASALALLNTSNPCS